MAKRDSLANTATLQFLMRVAASGRFREEFERDNFARNFPNYYGQHAIQGTHRETARIVMSCPDCLGGIHHLHDHLHKTGFLVGSCKNTKPYDRPLDYLWGLGFGTALLLSSVAGAFLAGRWRWVCAGVGVACAVWIFHRARYDRV